MEENWHYLEFLFEQVIIYSSRLQTVSRGYVRTSRQQWHLKNHVELTFHHLPDIGNWKLSSQRTIENHRDTRIHTYAQYKNILTTTKACLLHIDRKTQENTEITKEKGNDASRARDVKKEASSTRHQVRFRQRCCTRK